MESDSEEDGNSHPGQDENYGSLFFILKCYISAHVKIQPKSTNTKLFSMVALLNAYLPKSYLIMEECQQILGPPDPIHGGPPFLDRMQPFSGLMKVSGPRVRLIHPEIAKRSVELLADLNIRRSSIAQDCIFLLCGKGAKLSTVQFVKDLLTKREMGPKGKEKFSLLIKDIEEQENFFRALSVLIKASDKFQDKHIFPQTVARFYYTGGKYPNFPKAERWAKEAIERAPNNSYAADTLGQVYKNDLLRRAKLPNEVHEVAKKAFEAFRDVQRKAEKELGPEWIEYDSSVNLSDWFNNRGHFGFIQVAKILSEKDRHNRFQETLQSEVEAKFEFFEWYLSYSIMDRNTVEPDYFWKDVATCYKAYTGQEAADSTSFPALLDCLNRSLFVSKERRAFKDEVTEKTQTDLEQTRNELKAIYEGNVDDIQVAERYILSNIILTNKVPDSTHDPKVRELKSILQRFLPTNIRDPEFYLLVLLLFWPEENLQIDEENSKKKSQEPDMTEDLLQDQTPEEVDTNNEDTGEESEQTSDAPILDFDLQHYINLMEKTYETVYSKYLRGRYLLPFFFLGKGSGLKRWVHKSRLDLVVEHNVETELGGQKDNIKKRRKITDMWRSGKVWQLSEIQDMLQPIKIETKRDQDGEVIEMFVCVGEEKIKARTDCQPGKSAESQGCFYLGFNIRGPVIFEVKAP